MKKTVVYTAISGNYDELRQPKNVSENCDYVCFTDNEKIKSDFWKIRPFPDSGLDKVRKCRELKILPHKLFSDYDVSIWIDGNIDIIGNMDELIEKYILNDENKVITFKHCMRNCIYEEGEACIKQARDKKKIIESQLQKYIDEGYPVNNGLIESNVLIRNHNDKDVIDLMERWWLEVKNFSRRDQLSFNYAVWKNDASYAFMEGTSRNTNEYFLLKEHKERTVFAKAIYRFRLFIIKLFDC